jgi:hypothetical protein
VWVAYTLLALAIAATVLGPRGQRFVNAAMLAAGMFAAGFLDFAAWGIPGCPEWRP